ncbi:unnamed protein product [Kuraishia capsulata CBS 1993]|uniref:Mitochondrial peculiar membrane protein 1 n=1 Tax=Kuraishia capsulata CBS 1993 TaxID=1382522 RepID=W6MJ79_9ASCO|nr:uncharacterized protein KUCA_T00002277001 [Kuraishia capsulata CBS 1993]CDK26306.1 unnamed protein product [Kuraishia capsulata CBS 1993]
MVFGSGNNKPAKDSEIDENQQEFEKTLKKAEDSFKELVSSTNTLASDLAYRSMELWDKARNQANDVGSLWEKPSSNAGSLEQNTTASVTTDLDKFISSHLGAFERLFDDSEPIIDKSPFFWGRRRRGGFQKSNEYGMWAYPTPSPELYRSCLEKQGLSGWDERGYWRCLFPRGIIPADAKGILTKEDVEQGLKEGKFFPQVTDYLDWKGAMKENMKEQRRERWNRKKREWAQYQEQEKKKWDGVLASDNSKSSGLWAKDPEANSPRGDVTGSSSSYSFRSLPDGSTEKVSTTQQWFADGTSKVSEKKTVVDAAGKENISEFTKSLGPSKAADSAAIADTPSKGWFWDSKE